MSLDEVGINLQRFPEFLDGSVILIGIALNETKTEMSFTTVGLDGQQCAKYVRGLVIFSFFSKGACQDPGGSGVARSVAENLPESLDRRVDRPLADEALCFFDGGVERQHVLDVGKIGAGGIRPHLTRAAGIAQAGQGPSFGR